MLVKVFLWLLFWPFLIPYYLWKNYQKAKIRQVTADAGELAWYFYQTIGHGEETAYLMIPEVFHFHFREKRKELKEEWEQYLYITELLQNAQTSRSLYLLSEVYSRLIQYDQKYRRDALEATKRFLEEGGYFEGDGRCDGNIKKQIAHTHWHLGRLYHGCDNQLALRHYIEALRLNPEEEQWIFDVEHVKKDIEKERRVKKVRKKKGQK